MTELDIDGGKWCEGCYCYHIDVDKLISCLFRQGYDLQENQKHEPGCTLGNSAGYHAGDCCVNPSS